MDVSKEEGTLLGIAIRKKTRAPMDTLNSVMVTTGRGLVGDFRGKPGNRQVTVLSREDWDSACQELGRELPWTVRRANLLVEGIKLRETTDCLIHIDDLTLEVTGETDPCSRMEEAETGLTKALTPNWRGGVLCRVISDGDISLGAKVVLELRGSANPSP